MSARFGLLAAASLLGLAGCTTAQLQFAATDVSAACTDAIGAANTALLIGSASPGVVTVANGVILGCTSAEGLAKLAADPSSPQWLGIQQGLLTAAAVPTKPSA